MRVPEDVAEMQRQIRTHRQGSGNQREAGGIWANHHRVYRKQVDADEEIETPPEEVQEGWRITDASGVGEGGRERGSPQPRAQMRDAIAEKGAPAKKVST